jgi:hypothetical protein
MRTEAPGLRPWWTQSGHPWQRVAHCLLQPCGQRQVGRKAAQAIQRHLVPRRNRRSVHVMLQEAVGQHHMAHLHAWAQACGHACEHNALHMEVFDQRRGGGGCGHLANAPEHHHHLLPMQLADPEFEARDNRLLLARQELDDSGQLFLDGGHDGGSYLHQSLSRPSRRTRPASALADPTSPVRISEVLRPAGAACGLRRTGGHAVPHGARGQNAPCATGPGHRCGELCTSGRAPSGLPSPEAAGQLRGAYSMALPMSSTTFLASPKTIMVLSM